MRLILLRHSPPRRSGGAFGTGAGNVPGNVFNMPAFAQNYGPGIGFGGVSPMPQFGQSYGQLVGQLYGGWQQPFGQLSGGWQQPFGQTTTWWQQPQQQLEPYAGWQEPHLLAHLLRRHAGPISAIIASPYGQAQIAQNIAQTAEMLTRCCRSSGCRSSCHWPSFSGRMPSR
jgi:hypothetical protein